MDGSYKRLSVRVLPQIVDGYETDGAYSHEKNFDAFAEAVIRGLRTSGTVGAISKNGIGGRYSDIAFTAARPIVQQDWVAAISSASQSCGVVSDQNTWSFQ